ncbi:hypothetical protein RKD25_007222 [Streptomyces sp. SAI-124]
MKAPPAPMTSRIIAIAWAASLHEVLTSARLRPIRGPNTHTATSRVSSRAMGAEPMNATKCSAPLSPEVTRSVTAAPAISTTGSRATASDQPMPGISSSSKTRSLTSPLGISGFIRRTNGRRGHSNAMNAPTGTATNRP